MKPFCTLGHGQTSFSERATPAKDTTSLVYPALHMKVWLQHPCQGKGFCEHPSLSSSQIWHSSWLLQTDEILVFNQYPSELPQWAFTRANLDICQVHWQFAVISLSLFPSGTQRDLATFKSVCFCEPYFSKLCSQPLRSSILATTKKKKTHSQYYQRNKLRNFWDSFLLMFKLFAHNLGFVYLFVLCHGCEMTTVRSGRASAWAEKSLCH